MKRVARPTNVFSIFLITFCLFQFSCSNDEAQTSGFLLESSNGSCKIIFRESQPRIVVIHKNGQEILRKNIKKKLVLTKKDLAPGSYHYEILDKEGNKISGALFSFR